MFKRTTQYFLPYWIVVSYIYSSGYSDGPSVDFSREIATVLVEKCQSCHTAQKREGGLSFETIADLFKGGDNGTTIIQPRVSPASLLYQRISTHDENLVMPEGGPRLDERTIALFAAWIDSGASFGSLDPSTSIASLKSDAAINSVDTSLTSRSPRFVSIQEYPMTFPIRSLAFDPSREKLFVAGYGELFVVDVATKNLERRIATRHPFIQSIIANGDGIIVTSGRTGSVGTVELIDQLGSSSRLLQSCEDVPMATALDQPRNRIVVGGIDGSVTMIEIGNAKVLWKSIAHAAAVTDVAFSPNGDYVYSSSRDRTAKGYSADDGKIVSGYHEHERVVGGITCTNDGPITFEESGKLRLWPFKGDGNLIASRGQLENRILPIARIENNVVLSTSRAVQRFAIKREEVEDGKDAAGNLKKKTKTSFQELKKLTISDDKYATGESSQDERKLLASIAHTQRESDTLIASPINDGSIGLWKLDAAGEASFSTIDIFSR